MNENETNGSAADESSGKFEKNGKSPYGRDAVKKAILDAAEKLLLKKSPKEITVRQIAEAAKIKHPLIHRHFGTKDNVVLAVHARNIGKVQAQIGKLENLEGNFDKFFTAIKNNKFRQVALARAMIDGVNPHRLQNQFPVISHGMDLLKKRKNAAPNGVGDDSQILAATLGGAVLGWVLFEPFLLAATGLENEKTNDIEKKLIEIFEEVVQKM